MKKLKVNRTAEDTGIYLRFPIDENKNIFLNQSFNYFLNNELCHYINNGYKIEFDLQLYDIYLRRFI